MKVNEVDARHIEILRNLDGHGEVEASRSVPFQTLKAMERRGLVEVRTRVQSAIHTPKLTYKVARITDLGREALAKAAVVEEIEPDHNAPEDVPADEVHYWRHDELQSWDALGEAYDAYKDSEYNDTPVTVDGESRIPAHDELGELILQSGVWVLPGTDWRFIPAGPTQYFATHPRFATQKASSLRDARDVAHELGDTPNPRADLDNRWRPTDVQLDVARELMGTEFEITSVYLPVVTPGKTQTIWRVGQRVVGLPSYGQVRNASYEQSRNARDAASEVGEAYLRKHHADEGGTWAYCRVELDSSGYRGVRWDTVEDGSFTPAG